MPDIECETITELYVKILKKLDEEGIERSPRGINTKELVGISVKLNNPRTRFITEPLRRHSLKYIVNETKWYLSGDRKVDKISQHAKIWASLIDDIGEVNSNYGEKLFYKKVNDKTQFEHLIEELKKDINSRRAIFFLNLFDEDYKKMHFTKDFPCTVFGQFIVISGKLNLFMSQRSCDAIYGLCNDIVFFSLVQEMLAKKLGIEIGFLEYFYGSLHIYENMFERLKGKDFVNFNVISQIPFRAMTEEDVDALISQNYEIHTPFMIDFNYGAVGKFL